MASPGMEITDGRHQQAGVREEKHPKRHPFFNLLYTWTIMGMRETNERQNLVLTSGVVSVGWNVTEECHTARLHEWVSVLV